jgi:hypothetical protein
VRAAAVVADDGLAEARRLERGHTAGFGRGDRRGGRDAIPGAELPGAVKVDVLKVGRAAGTELGRVGREVQPAELVESGVAPFAG